jgi:hypothetical protein
MAQRSERMAGYSGTPLPKKLGIKAGARLLLLDAPRGFVKMLAPLPEGVHPVRRLGEQHDVILLFVRERRRLEERIAALQAALAPSGGLWIAWPKKASGVATDITEDALREVGLPRGLVDNKVCAIDETWSGLRFVLRKELRPKR